MLAGPVFSREAIVAPRRDRHYIMRTVYATFLLLLICTAWMILAGTQIIRNVGDMARFGSILFQLIAPLQLALILFLSALQAASSVAIEKDRQTLILLLMSRLSNSELVLGKLLASLLNVAVMIVTSLPILMLIVLFGGVSFVQVAWTIGVTAITALWAGSLGTTIALWREKTFQTLALVSLAIVFWIGIWEGVGLIEGERLGVDTGWLAGATSPIRAILTASSPDISTESSGRLWPFVIVAGGMTAALCGISFWRVRKWNPSRDVRPGQQEEVGYDIDAITGRIEVGASGSMTAVPVGRHIDDRARHASHHSRRVWDNPVLWREMCTWAYGRKIFFIRASYWLLAGFTFFALYGMVASRVATRTSASTGVSIAPAAKPTAPFILVSLVMVNALAVTSITNERDGRALDLLFVTDLSPKEFLFGKLVGVLYVTIDVVVMPIIICGYLWYSSVLSLENLAYMIIGLIMLNVFVAVLGLHCGMSYVNSRTAIGVSLGTVFFLFLGVVTSMVMMVSFTGNVEAQLPPFLACIVGGAIGLYVVLGRNTPSPALAVAACVLPAAMFYSITSLLLGNFLSVLLVVLFAYGFATTAMIMPRLGEFVVSLSHAKNAEEG